MDAKTYLERIVKKAPARLNAAAAAAHRRFTSPPDGTRSGTETVTPGIALAMLRRTFELGFQNRSIDQRVVARYASLMQAKQWELNGETVTVDDRGALLNGQHRLLACLVADVPFDVVLVTGVARHTFTTMDQGRSRSLGQVAGMAGVAESGPVMTAVLHLTTFERDTRGKIDLRDLNVRNSADGAAATLIEKAEHRYAGITGIAQELARGEAKRALAELGVARADAAFALYVFRNADPDAAGCFFDALVTGANLRNGDPVLTLRKRLLATRGQGFSQERRQSTVYFLFRAFAAYLEDAPLGVLKLPAEMTYPDVGYQARQ
jgi:hypothetical protein